MTNLGVYSGCMVFLGDYSFQIRPHFELFNYYKTIRTKSSES